MVQQVISTGTFCEAKFVVDSDASQGGYTTIGSALTAATSGSTIFIRPGTYTENLTLKAGVNLTAFGSDSSLNATGDVIISGKATFTGSGTVTISGIQLQTNSDFLLAVTGSAASVVNLNNCYLNCTNNTGISHTVANTASTISIYHCNGNLGTTGICYWVSTSTGTINTYYCSFGNSGASTTATTSSAGIIGIGFSNFNSPISTTSTGGIVTLSSSIDSGPQNVTALTANGTGASACTSTRFSSGSASAISIGTGASLPVSSCTVLCSNASAITGVGTIQNGGISFIGTSSVIDSGLTVTLRVFSAGQFEGRAINTAPSAGMIGEQMRASLVVGSAATLTTGTPKTVTGCTITLTPGIWDVSGIVSFVSNAATSSSDYQMNLSTTDNAIVGNYGDQAIEWQNSTAVVAQSPTLTIPAFRVSISSNTTYYLVAQSSFTLNSMKAYGRISATRVA